MPQPGCGALARDAVRICSFCEASSPPGDTRGRRRAQQRGATSHWPVGEPCVAGSSRGSRSCARPSRSHSGTVPPRTSRGAGRATEPLFGERRSPAGAPRFPFPRAEAPYRRPRTALARGSHLPRGPARPGPLGSPGPPRPPFPAEKGPAAPDAPSRRGRLCAGAPAAPGRRRSPERERPRAGRRSGPRGGADHRSAGRGPRPVSITGR